MPRAGATVVALLLSTILLAMANVVHAGGSGSSNIYYGLGAALTGAHFLFAPRAVALPIAIKNDQSRGKGTQDMRA